MERRVVVTVALAAALLCGCEDAGQSRSLDADIDRARAQIAVRADEKQRLETELRKLERLVPERQKLEARQRALLTEKAGLAETLRQERSRP